MNEQQHKHRNPLVPFIEEALEIAHPGTYGSERSLYAYDTFTKFAGKVFSTLNKRTCMDSLWGAVDELYYQNSSPADSRKILLRILSSRALKEAFETLSIYQKTSTRKASVSYASKFNKILEAEIERLFQESIEGTAEVDKINDGLKFKEQALRELDTHYFKSAADAERFNKIKLLQMKRYIRKLARTSGLKQEEISHPLTAFLLKYGSEFTANEFFECRFSNRVALLKNSLTGIYIPADELLKHARETRGLSSASKRF